MAEDRTTYITEDMKFRGEVSYDEKIVIEGKVEGRVRSGGKLEVKPSADVLADLDVKDINIQGTLQGNVSAEDSVHITSGGKHTGDITCKSLQIDKGGVHNGTTVMS